ncbi:MAG: SpoIIIAH-like family protein [Clostridiales bacterium]|jgi:stage III sporulation protein AH|uniref:SpoIIIAH-like family protein n=1 Tax=Caproicibacterium sp. BJN0003 TaxID=2994078 RepID=UPI001598EBBA|nr:SpoIIIAH-like family protein [Caproicibacterium sp. BJN0003]MCI1951555.1 SpoIIIAH-like family protein [Clostridiales bacterium]MCI2160482.1 SpoIIIAH-like family protein [Oscillospiraceae bacterium]CAB1250095.1 Sporulation protein [Ruminococcaceae bacterium BL-4]MCI1960730.1 SpoIIIAH-like family protein [Clostridiales bacterium]MCI2021171.1 SpoIIIAH-like family protein [Clostridiales bacterium]
MKMGKRQVILAALVVALGAAVYLNWQFAGGNTVQMAGTTASEKELGQAQLVNADPSTSSVADSSEEITTSSAASGSDSFTQARLTRQKARDQAVELLEKVTSDVSSSDDAKKEAVTQAAQIAQNIQQENNAENLIKAKGFNDCVVYLQNGTCNVVVSKGDKEMSEAVMLIKDIVVGQTGVTYDKIKIIESK